MFTVGELETLGRSGVQMLVDDLQKLLSVDGVESPNHCVGELRSIIGGHFEFDKVFAGRVAAG